MDVVDLRTGTVIRRLEGLKQPQGLAFPPGSDELEVARAGDKTVRLFRGPELAPAGMVNLADDAPEAELASLSAADVQYNRNVRKNRPQPC